MRYVLPMLLLSTAAFADPRVACPQGPCKVITLNEAEEKALTGERMVFDTAVAGRQLDLMGVISYFRTKVATAPQGDMPKPVEPPAQPGSSVEK